MMSEVPEEQRFCVRLGQDEVRWGGGEAELMDSSTRTQRGDPGDAVAKDTRAPASSRGAFTPQLYV